MEAFFNTQYLSDIFEDKLSDSRAKGIDKRNSLTYNKELENEIIIRKVLSGTYTFSPYLEVLKLKGRFKLPRVISIPTIRDRLVILVIKEILHSLFPNCVNKKLPNNYITEVKRHLTSSRENIYYLQLDIQKFYDAINRVILLEILKNNNLDERLIELISKAIATPTVPTNCPRDSYEHFLVEKGVPQGLSISNILAQIYLGQLDIVLTRKKFFFCRYVDDILILRNRSISKPQFLGVKSALDKLDLELNKDKTKRGVLSYSNDEKFVFLGYKMGKNRISIGDNNIEKFIRRIAGKFTWFLDGAENETKRPRWMRDDIDRFKEVFVEELNEMITGSISKNKNYGWLFYFSSMDDLSLLFKIDKIILAFFEKNSFFENQVPSSLKRLARTYYVIKHGKNKSYINNYDLYDTVLKKREYLIWRGAMSPTIAYDDSKIESLFESFMKRKISQLERDIGYGYF